ncbi:hypothetical protein J4E86_009261 [Alternaria arbusti]|uniref:uncharacterized protein n=1 Tax=Alternaria arbusti TaxID=232088 RepID=UPI00221FE9D5|nr:uncharacterized protein J4E86_009261 [Alternaria arbusti]KAI4945374.1 hypothetical protein J4E86_009261 [Alternaria arbusti]
MSRRRDFVHPDITTETMGFLGPNIVTAKDESWSRQRRIVAPALNERISPEVWRVSVEQASSMADLLPSVSPPHAAKGPAKIVLGLRTIAMNVLGRIAYGHDKPFALSQPSTKPSADISYVDAISLVTDKLIYAAFLPASFLCLPFMPQVSQRLGTALKRLPGLTQHMLNEERQNNASKSPHSTQTTESPNNSRGTIMEELVRLSDQEKTRTDASTPDSLDKVTKKFLTEEEIAGNLFIFTAAGFDTTANTMSYAVALLAVYPEWQAWIQTEIDTVLGGPDMSPIDYASAFPKLVRCLAVMLETLRLYPPVTLLMRSITTSQNLAFGDTSFQIAAPSTIYVNTAALHTSRSTWGSDALSFNPARWLQPDTTEPTLITPAQGTFMPWSVGPRNL